MDFDWIVVGAGVSGATLAQKIASERNETVLVVEQRDHIAGNLYDEYNEVGILEHKYGPHIFHTNSREVWNYLSRFTGWREYSHQVKASIDGQLVPLPFNLNAIDQLFPCEMGRRLSETLIRTYGFGAQVPILKMREAEDQDVRFLADYVYRKVFEGYTRKQWGLSPEELSPSVTARVPVRVSRDNRYFQDAYQGIPQLGYTAMVRRMLEHPNIHLMLKTRWQDLGNSVGRARVVFTGCIDEFFGFSHGELPYRSLRFAPVTVQKPQYQAVATVNFPNDYDFTRITELTHLSGQVLPCTTLIYEFPQHHVYGQTIPYYPIPAEANREIYARYVSEAGQLAGTTVFAGRLADYAYYNMDQAVASALAKFHRISDR